MALWLVELIGAIAVKLFYLPFKLKAKTKRLHLLLYSCKIWSIALLLILSTFLPCVVPM